MMHTYAMRLMIALIAFIMAWVGLQLKELAKKWLDTKEKQAVAKTCVLFVQQVYRELAGPEKMQRALETARGMLEKKGIDFSADEMTVMMEAAIAEFKNAFYDTAAVLAGVQIYPDEDPADAESGD